MKIIEPSIIANDDNCPYKLARKAGEASGYFQLENIAISDLIRLAALGAPDDIIRDKFLEIMDDFLRKSNLEIEITKSDHPDYSSLIRIIK